MEPHITRRRLPHWTNDGSTYFVTFRLVSVGHELGPAERKIVLEHLKSGDPIFYYLRAAVVMPDHAHAIFRPRTGYELSRVMKGIKGVSARLLNEYWGRGTVWQDESFDRILRDRTEVEEKLGYMVNNPIEWGLVTDGWDYDGWYCRAVEPADN